MWVFLGSLAIVVLFAIMFVIVAIQMHVEDIRQARQFVVEDEIARNRVAK